MPCSRRTIGGVTKLPAAIGHQRTQQRQDDV